jgi:vacuolar-type H+-ATPase subunit I/STV1
MNDEKNKNKEQLNQLNILLETFVLTNNVYSINLKSISSRSFKIYFNRNEKIKALVELTNSIKRKKISLSKVKSNGESQVYQNDVRNDHRTCISHSLESDFSYQDSY